MLSALDILASAMLWLYFDVYFYFAGWLFISQSLGNNNDDDDTGATNLHVLHL